MKPTEDYHKMQKCEYYQSEECDCLTECSAILKESTPSTEQESQDVTEREIYNALKEDDDLTNDINALGYFKSEAGKFMWIKTYLAGMYQSGVTEFRISLTDKKTGLIHPLGKDGKTLDFHL